MANPQLGLINTWCKVNDLILVFLLKDEVKNCCNLEINRIKNIFAPSNIEISHGPPRERMHKKGLLLNSGLLIILIFNLFLIHTFSDLLHPQTY